MKRGRKPDFEKYINMRIAQLKQDMEKAHDDYDKQWYNRIIQELTWAYEMQSENKTNCYMEQTHVGAIGGKEIWS